MTRTLLLAAFIAVAVAAPASAAPFTVTKTADTNDGACAPGNCSLRDAVIAANAAAGADTINLPAGHFTLTGAAGEDAAASGDLDVSGGALTVVGQGAASTTIDGANNDRIFDGRDAASPLTLSGLTLTGGKADMGAAVQALRQVTLDGVSVTGNTAGGSGTPGFGAIAIADSTAGDASLTISHSTISSNQLGGGGAAGYGAVFVEPNGNATITLTNSQFNSNQLGGGASSSGFGTLFVQAHQLNLNIDGSRFGDNHLGGGGTNSSGFGGAVFAQASGGSAAISDSTFDGNTVGGGGSNSSGYGGALFLQPGAGFALTVSRSTFSGNVAAPGVGGFGGAIFEQPGSSGSTTLTNTTMSGNTAGASSTAGAFGGGIFFQSTGATLALDNSTIASNAAGDAATSGTGGAIYATGAPVTAQNTILAGNSAGGAPNSCQAVLTSGGHNIEDGTSCGFTDATDLNANPLLAALGDYGGPTQTRALLSGSPAIDHGAGCPLTDQRGMPRPFGPACDIGAYEFAPPVSTTGAASGLTPTGAVLTGGVIPNVRPASAHFEYGKTTGYGSQSSPLTVTGALATVAIKASISGLTPGTLYHYRLVATGDATAAGTDLTFTTPFPKPKLSRLRLSPSTFPAAASGGSTAAKSKTGTNITYTDNEASKTTFKVLKPAAGRRQGKSCRKPSARNRHGRACTRFVVVGSFSHKDKAGRNKIHFTGRVHRHKLAPGKYRLSAAPRAHGKAGKSVTARFKVIP